MYTKLAIPLILLSNKNQIQSIRNQKDDFNQNKNKTPPLSQFEW